MTCLDHLADGLATYIRAGEINPNLYDSNGKLRLNFESAGQEVFLGAAFDQLRHASRDNATVLLHILDAIEIIGRESCSSEVRKELIRHIHLVQEETRDSALVEPDQQRIGQRCEMLARALQTASTRHGPTLNRDQAA
jgi:uncharacterized membrane protein